MTGMFVPVPLRGVIALAASLVCFDALAKEKPKPPKEIVIENARKVALLSFEIVHVPVVSAKPGKPEKPRPPVLMLEKPLAAGEAATVKLIGAKGCDYLARWAFEDAGDEGPLDLCHDPKIVLTD